MLAYNGSIPGPTLRVREGSEVTVDVTNDTEMEATVHWHGLRLENRYDGTHETQAPIPVGATSPIGSRSRIPASTGTTRTSVRTTARRWASTATSSSTRRSRLLAARAPRDRLTLDDVLLEDGKIAPFSRTETTHWRWAASAPCSSSAASPTSP